MRRNSPAVQTAVCLLLAFLWFQPGRYPLGENNYGVFAPTLGIPFSSCL